MACSLKPRVVLQLLVLGVACTLMHGQITFSRGWLPGGKRAMATNLADGLEAEEAGLHEFCNAGLTDKLQKLYDTYKDLQEVIKLCGYEDLLENPEELEKAGRYVNKRSRVWKALTKARATSKH